MSRALRASNFWWLGVIVKPNYRPDSPMLSSQSYVSTRLSYIGLAEQASQGQYNDGLLAPESIRERVVNGICDHLL